MQLLRETLDRVLVEDPVVYRNLAMFPLVGPAVADPGYVPLGEALGRGTFHVREVSEAGSVPQLLVVNDGALPVLLLDGEELVGAKQNRVVNLTILAPALKPLTIPVSCVEQGRWRYRGPEFTDSPRTMFPTARARKLETVTASVRERGDHSADQGAVWDDVADKARRMGVRSDTGAMSDIYERHGRSVAEYVRRFQPRPHQTGALFAVGGEVFGLDLFDAPPVLRAYLPKLVHGYALDALEHPEEAPAPRESDALALVHGVASARTLASPGVGLGENVRLLGHGTAGAALAWEGRLVHLAAFRSSESGRAADEGAPIRRSRQRRLLS